MHISVDLDGAIYTVSIKFKLNINLGENDNYRKIFTETCNVGRFGCKIHFSIPKNISTLSEFTSNP